jgi:predicted dehydrogenase
MSIGLGLFGYGFIAEAHMEGLRRIPEFRVQAVCGPNPGRAHAFADRYAIPTVVTDPAELLRLPAIDAVLVDAPDRAHAPLVLAAAAHHKHIFCEKPLAASLDEARAMVDAARQAGVRTLMGFSNRWNPLFLQVRDLLAAGRLGTVYHVHSQNFNAALLGPTPPFTWRTDPTRTGSGILGDLGAHAIDLIQFLLGPIAEVCASLRTCRSPLFDPVTGRPQAAAVDDDVNLLLRLASGVEGTLALSRLGAVYSDFPIGHRQLLIDGSAGGLAYANGEARLYRPDHSWEVLPGEVIPPGMPHAEFLARGTERILRTFLEAIQTGRDLPPTLEDGLRCQAVLHAAAVSSQERCWTTVPTGDSAG